MTDTATRPLRRRVALWTATVATLAISTFVGRKSGANEVTMALVYMVLVLGTTTVVGRIAGAVISVLATGCLNFYFLAPPGHMFVDERDDMVALVTFLAASTLVARLLTRARDAADRARARQLEVEGLWRERERLLAETAHVEALRESEALKTGLLRAVSHDLRTPLTALRLEIESLERQLHAARNGNGAGPAIDEEPLHTVRRLSSEQQRLARRIDNLLALARLEAGLARLHVEPVPASWLFRAAAESLSSLLAERRFERRVAADCPELAVDPSLALEIIVNLLENAARAAGSGGSIELAAASAGEMVAVEVRDRGPGVPASVARELEDDSGVLWAPGEDAGPRERLGLGLQIARSFAAAHGGSLQLIPRNGGGTTARVELPAVLVPHGSELERQEQHA